MKVLEKAFIKLFSMSLGAGIQGRRDTGDQSIFKAKLVKDYNTAHDNKDRAELLWCCVTGEFFDANSTIAAHLFPYRYGTDRRSFTSITCFYHTLGEIGGRTTRCWLHAMTATLDQNIDCRLTVL